MSRSERVHAMAQSPHHEKPGVKQPVSSEKINPSQQQKSTAPLRAELVQLPPQYFKALVKPSIETYSQDRVHASWSLVWVQLLVWAILDAALGLLVNLISPPATGSF